MLHIKLKHATNAHYLLAISCIESIKTQLYLLSGFGIIKYRYVCVTPT